MWLVQGLVPDVRAGELIWVGPHVGQGLLREQNLKISRRNSAFGTTARKDFVLSSKRYAVSVYVTEDKIDGLCKKYCILQYILLHRYYIHRMYLTNALKMFPRKFSFIMNKHCETFFRS
jgi:hypothetical protein